MEEYISKKCKCLNLQQRMFIQAYLKTKSIVKAKREAGYSTISRNVPAFFKKWLEEIGLSDENLKKILYEGLTCEKEHFFAHQGNVKDARKTPDWDTRRFYLDMAFKVFGFYAPERHEVLHGVISYEDMIREIRGQGEGGDEVLSVPGEVTDNDAVTQD